MRNVRQGIDSFAVLGLFIASIVISAAQSGPDPGEQALRQGDYKRAEIFYRDALAHFPDSPEVLSNLGTALAMQGKSSEAIAAFEKALRQKQLARTYALLAEQKCETRDLDGARPMLAEIFRSQLRTPSILAIVAPCYLELDEAIESVSVYESLLSYESYPHDLALMQLAKSYRRAGAFFVGRLSRAPDKGVYMKALIEAIASGSANYRSAFGDAEKASPYFQADLDFHAAVARWREHPQDSALLYLLSVLSSEQSVQEVESCEEKYPDSPYLAKLKAEMLADQGHDGEAVALYEKLLQTNPELPDLYFDQGMLFRKERQWEPSLDAFRKQLAKNPDDERTAARVSEALIQLGRWKELSDFLSPRVKSANAPLWVLQDFANAAQNLDDRDGAISVLTVAEQRFPDEKAVHYQLMLLYRKKGEIARAQKELRLFQALSK